MKLEILLELFLELGWVLERCLGPLRMELGLVRMQMLDQGCNHLARNLRSKSYLLDKKYNQLHLLRSKLHRMDRRRDSYPFQFR